MAEEAVNPASALQGIEYQGNEFASLLKKEFKPKSDDAKSAVEQAVLTLAQQALSQTNLIGSDVVMSIEAMIAELDKRMSKQVNAILHHEDFQKLQSAWRGLHYLFNNTESDEMLKIRVMNISKLDLGKTLKRYKGTAWDQSPLFKKVYEAEYGQFGGEPRGRGPVIITEVGSKRGARTTHQGTGTIRAAFSYTLAAFLDIVERIGAVQATVAVGLILPA